MISGINSSLSGLFAFSRVLASSANNVANVNTDGYKGSTATIVEDPNGLPDVKIEKSDTPGSMIQDRTGSLHESSNVDLAAEFPRMMITQRAYEANIKALRIQNETIGSLLDITG